ncbi:MAG: hypothetical protein EDM05_006420 [Leptolyngbya sp. IPPAS B-1204]
MMPETNQIAIRRQLAKDAASEAIKSLFTVYWADSFDVNRLQDRLVDLIFFLLAMPKLSKNLILILNG